MLVICLKPGPLGPERVIDIVSQVASALDHAHGLGVIHRDVKPANLILEADGRVRLADFGIARTVDDAATITATGELVGTITYLAPEILDGDPATVASDVYSLGAVTYELLSGRPPYRAETPAATLEAVRNAEVPDLLGIVPDAMAAAVSAAMAKDPAARPETAGSFAGSLIGSATLVMAASPVTPTVHRGSEEPTVVTDRPSPPIRPAQPVRRRRSPWPVLVLLLAAVAVAVAAISNDPPGEPSGELAATTTASLRHHSTSDRPNDDHHADYHDDPGHDHDRGDARGSGRRDSCAPDYVEPPEFRQSDVSKVEDRLEQVMKAWDGDKRDELIRELEKAFEEVADLEESAERDELTARLIQLAELMGFRVDQIGQGDGEGDDDG